MVFFGNPRGWALFRQSCGITAARYGRAPSRSSPNSTPRIPTSSLFRIAGDRAVLCAYIQDLVALAPPSERARRMVDLQEDEVDDVIAGLTYLKSQPFVDPARIAISGCSYGGIQTLLIGERDLGVRALVPFAPGAMSWEQNLPLRARLIQAIDRAKAPVFLIQAENDYDLAPSRALSKEANKKHKDFQSKIYPRFGSTEQDGHWKFCSSATDVWGNDVLAFLEAQMKRAH